MTFPSLVSMVLIIKGLFNELLLETEIPAAPMWEGRAIPWVRSPAAEAMGGFQNLIEESEEEEGLNAEVFDWFTKTIWQKRKPENSCKLSQQANVIKQKQKNKNKTKTKCQLTACNKQQLP